MLGFATPEGARTPPGSYGIALADLNGDGNLDAVVTNMCTTQADCTNGSVSVFLGNGDGTFQAGVIYSSGGYGISCRHCGLEWRWTPGHCCRKRMRKR